MSYGFNKMNNKVLSFDIIKNIDQIKFNHYIMRKENLSRLNNNLGKSQFIITISSVSKDLDVSKGKAQRLIKQFEDLGIIKSISKGNQTKGYSIYEYITQESKTPVKNDEDNDKNSDKVVDTYEDSDCKCFIKFDDKDNDIDFDKEVVNSKKENIKKDLNKSNLYNNIINYLNKKANKNFKSSTQKTKSCIDARLKEGFVEDDFYKVIDVKVSQWMYNNMQKFLRPETLFSNKFEGYLNEIVINPKESEKSKCESLSSWDIEFDFLK